jgi:hypothetical protein
MSAQERIATILPMVPNPCPSPSPKSPCGPRGIPVNKGDRWGPDILYFESEPMYLWRLTGSI